MNRRKFLATSGSVISGAIAGCSGESVAPEQGGTETETPPEPATESRTPTPIPPQYDQSDEEDMVISLDPFPDGWERDDEVNDNFDAVFLSEDEDITVLIGIDVRETIEGAGDRYDYAKERADANEFSLADEAFWGKREEVAFAVFRHSNAFGQCWASRWSSLEWVPDIGRAQSYAGELVTHWDTVQSEE